MIGDVAVSDINTGHVTRILTPIWNTKPETASRVRGRIETVLDYAKVHGWRTGENPARWKGHLDNVLPRRAKVAEVAHHAALPWAEVGAFMAELEKQDGVAALAFRFTILTAARTGEVIGARWSEIDHASRRLDGPGIRMKAGIEHRVPLSDAALAVLRKAAKLRPQRDGRAGIPRRQGAGCAGCPTWPSRGVLRRMQRERPDRARVPFDVPRLGGRDDKLSA